MNSFDQKFAIDWYEKHIKKEPKKYLLWVDDLRGVPNNYIGEYEIIIARNYKSTIEALHRFRFDVICLDHDLGDGPTGYDLCKYIIAKNIYCPEYRIHTSNPVGRKNMAELLERYTNSIIRIM